MASLSAGALSQTPRETSMTSPCDCKSLRNTTASSMSEKLTKLRLHSTPSAVMLSNQSIALCSSINFMFVNSDANEMLLLSSVVQKNAKLQKIENTKKIKNKELKNYKLNK